MLDLLTESVTLHVPSHAVSSSLVQVICVAHLVQLVIAAYVDRYVVTYCKSEVDSASKLRSVELVKVLYVGRYLQHVATG